MRSERVYEIEIQGFPTQSLVTVAVEDVEFRKPVFVGDTLSFWTRVRRIGETSITMHVTVDTERDGQSRLLTQADVTYVAWCFGVMSEGLFQFLVAKSHDDGYLRRCKKPPS